jgi:hypothetical protein
MSNASKNPFTLEWFTTLTTLAAPVETDFYKVARQYYNEDQFTTAAGCLELLIVQQQSRPAAARNSKLLVSALHLLGYAHLNNVA